MSLEEWIELFDNVINFLINLIDLLIILGF